MTLFTIIPLILIFGEVQSSDNQECDVPLGMENGKIKNSQITALTWLYHDRAFSRYYRPWFNRLNFNNSGGGWCSEEHDRYPGQYIEVDLLTNTKITAIATQGRFGGSEWVDEYGIVYKRDDDKEYRQYTEEGRWKIFRGNNDSIHTVKRVFSHPIIARVIRIIPQGNEFTIYCMRMELFGCKWKKSYDGLLYYFSHLGSVMDNVLNLGDYGYDGTIYPRLGFETHGLGQLTDDVYGTQEVKKGSHSDWVGFNTRNPVVTFTFKRPRNFMAIKFHIFHQAPTITVFQSVEISVGFSSTELREVKTYVTRGQSLLQSGIFKVTVSLLDAVGTHLKCKFTLDGHWMLISEVDFVSEPGRKESNHAGTYNKPSQQSKEGIKEEGKDSRNSRIRTLWPKALTLPPDIHKSNELGKDGFGEETDDNNLMYHQSGSRSGNPKGLSFPIIVSIVLGAIVIVVVMVVIIVRRIKHAQNKEKRKQTQCTNEANAGPKATDLLTNNKIIVHTNGSAHYSAKLLDHGYYKDSMDRYSVDGKLQMI